MELQVLVSLPNFLWGDQPQKKKIHLINWNTVTKSKEDGGLGLKRSRCRNKALPAKRARTLKVGTNDLWAKTLTTKYSSPDNTHTKKISFIWKSIADSMPICIEARSHSWLIKNGQTTNLWLDNWTSLGPLRKLPTGPLN